MVDLLSVFRLLVHLQIKHLRLVTHHTQIEDTHRRPELFKALDLELSPGVSIIYYLLVLLKSRNAKVLAQFLEDPCEAL